MSGLQLMWRNTRMVVLCAISAALYAAVLVPFKVVPLIPGVTELRPANAIPVVCSFLFGPAAAWGSAIGNMIGDFFGGASPGDIFGFFANLVYALIPFKVWETIGGGQSPVPRTPLAAVYPRVRKGRLLYGDVMPELKPRPLAFRITGIALLIAGAGGAWLLGNLLSTGYWTPRFLPAWMTAAPYDKAVLILVSPMIFLAFAGLALM